MRNNSTGLFTLLAFAAACDGAGESITPEQVRARSEALQPKTVYVRSIASIQNAYLTEPRILFNWVDADNETAHGCSYMVLGNNNKFVRILADLNEAHEYKIPAIFVPTVHNGRAQMVAGCFFTVDVLLQRPDEYQGI